MNMREYPTLQIDTNLSKVANCCKKSYGCLQQAVPLLKFVSICKVGYSLMFIYIHSFSSNKLFPCLNLCLIVKLDILSCSFTSITFLKMNMIKYPTLQVDTNLSKGTACWKKSYGCK
jgi:hypothetical protein